MYRVLLIAIALIVYGSLWPWQYNPAHAAGNPLSILLHTWPGKGTAYDLEDIVVNLLLYIPVGMFGYLALDRRGHRLLRIFGPIVLGSLLSGCIEMLQIYDKTRTCSAVDLACNTVSAALGVLLGLVFRESLKASVRRPAAAQALHASGPLVLVILWVGYETLPLFPITLKIAGKVHSLSSGRLSIVEFLASLAAWLTVARLLESIYESKLAWRLLLALSLLAPIKIFIDKRVPTWSELAGLVFALVIWKITMSGLPSRTWLLAAFSIFMLVIGGLSPFRFGAHNHFSWLPFLALLQTPWEDGLVILCQKSFLYGSAVWLLWASGQGLLRATVLVAFILGLIETLQIYVPGRTSEITDPILAVLLGLILWFLEVHGRRAKLRLPQPDLARASL